MAPSQVAAILGVFVIAVALGYLGTQILKALGVLWSKAGGFVVGGLVVIVAAFAFTAFSTKCVEKCEVYETTLGPIFATPKPVPTQTPIYIQVTAAPTPDPRNPCVVVSGTNLTCRGLP
jgi:hypothetical protein